MTILVRRCLFGMAIVTMRALSVRAKVFIIVEAMASLLVWAFAVAQWRSSGAATFIVLLGLSAAAGAMKVVLPGIQGNLSASYLFVIWGIVRMSLGETLLMGLVSSVVQAYWHCKKKPAPIQLVFNLAVISISIGAGSLAFKAGWVQELLPNQVFRLLLAALVYFLVNTISVSGIIGLTEGLSIVNVWRNSYFWSFPHYLLSASLVSACEYLNKKLGMEVTILVLPPAYLMYHMFAMHISRLNDALERAKTEREHAEKTASLHLRTIRALALAIEAKDQTTAEHLHRVQTYAMGLAADCGLPQEEWEALRAASILHDVGKIAVPEHIISKPGKLTPDEFTKMKVHTVVGAEIVMSADFPFAVAPIVRSHHEKWDGTGYPDGLKGAEIPLGSRILSAVDCLDALASDRQYRKAMPIDKAMAIIQSESGKSFDPKVVEALTKRCYELESLAQSTFVQDPVKLSVDAVVNRGLAPDAGYAAGSHTEQTDLSENSPEVWREMSLLNSITAQLGRSESIEDDLLAITPRLRELIPFDCIALYRPRLGTIECVFAQGEAATMFLGLTLEPGVGASGWTFANRTPLVNGNATTEFGGEKLKSDFALISSLSIPLESERGPIGALTLYSRQRDAFQSAHLRALLAIRSKLTYRMNMDLSGITRGARAADPPEALENPLDHLSKALDGAPSVQHR